jgi:hypothetical protein
MHDRYGKITLNGTVKFGIVYEISDNFFELPISNLQLNGHIFPLGGGGFFRLIPNFFFKMGIKNILKKENAYLFYMHPWEIDSEQPRVKKASAGFKFRHYTNLGKTGDNLTDIIHTFSRCRFNTCSQYLKEKKQLKWQ